MEPTSQNAGQQQGRQQPVYDIRNGGHYGKILQPNRKLIICTLAVLANSVHQVPAQL